MSNVRDKLVRKDLAKNISKSLLRCIQRGDYHEFRRFFDSDSSQASRELLAFALQNEQIECLTILFTLFFSEHETAKDKHVIQNMAQYLHQSC